MASLPPLYQQILESIREQIISGKLKYGEKLPAQKELAKNYNVSLITVKRAILELVKEGLVHGYVGKGVFVGSAANSRAAPTPEIESKIGVIMTDMTSPYYTAVLQALEQEAAQQNYFVLFSTLSGAVPDESQQIMRLQKIGVSGFIVASRRHNRGLLPPLLELVNRGLPIVFVSYVPDNNASYIGADHRLGGYLATEHLLKQGYKKIAYAAPDTDSPLARLRYKGYADALSDFSLSSNEQILFCQDKEDKQNRFEVGYKLGKELVAKKSMPQAIFAYSDLVALGLKRAFAEARLDIPQDIALVGFDDIPMAGQSSVPLTTIRQPVDQIGRLAFDTLRRKIEGDNAVTRMSLMPQLVIRQSTGGQSAESGS